MVLVRDENQECWEPEAAPTIASCLDVWGTPEGIGIQNGIASFQATEIQLVSFDRADRALSTERQ